MGLPLSVPSTAEAAAQCQGVGEEASSTSLQDWGESASRLEILLVLSVATYLAPCFCTCTPRRGPTVFVSLYWQGLRLRAGIVGIERNIEKKQQQTGQQVSQAFKDLDALIDKASLPQLSLLSLLSDCFVVCRLRTWSVW